MVQVVECLSGMHKALGSIPNTGKEKSAHFSNHLLPHAISWGRADRLSYHRTTCYGNYRPG
jgi:hypothetical protein